MKQFLLSTNAGGMARDTAREKMADAKRRCGGTAGSLMLSQPDNKGSYIAEFGNDDHAAEFARILDALRNVRYERVSNPVPLKPQPRLDSAISNLADALGVAQRNGTGPFSKRRPFGPL